MAFDPIGSAGAQKIFFNSGILSVNSEQIADVGNITINMSFDVKNYRTLNSILKRAQRRATHEASVSCTVYGYHKKLYEIFFSQSSAVANGQDYDIKDGQQESLTVVLTAYEDEDTNKPVQFQLHDPIFSTHGVNQATEDFGQTSLEIMCIKITLFVDEDVTA